MQNIWGMDNRIIFSWHYIKSKHLKLIDILFNSLFNILFTKNKPDQLIIY